MAYSLIKNGIVENVIECDAAFAAHIAPEWDAVVPSQGSAIGWAYSDGVFTAPLTPPPPADPCEWLVDVGPFKNRLGIDAPAIGASDHSACKGVVAMLAGRLYVDLQDPLLASMLDALIATAQPAADPVWPGSGPMTPAKKAAVLGVPAAPHENFGLRKTYFS